MTSCPEAGLRILRFEKKAVSWDLNSEQESWDSTLEGRQFSELAEAILVVCGGVAARSGVRWKSQHRKKLCLSFLMPKNLKLKKVDKSFVPEPISCFSDSYMRMNICERFPYLYEYVYFTYSYLGRTFWRGYVTLPARPKRGITRFEDFSGTDKSILTLNPFLVTWL